MEGLRPSSSAHVSWREHGAPVRFCLVRWALLVLQIRFPPPRRAFPRQLKPSIHGNLHVRSKFADPDGMPLEKQARKSPTESVGWCWLPASPEGTADTYPGR